MRGTAVRHSRLGHIVAVLREAGRRIVATIHSLYLIGPPSPGGWPTAPFMLPHERPIILVRRHPGMLVAPFVLLAATFVVAILASAGVIPGNGTLLAILWGAWLVLLLGSLAATAAWYTMFLALTDKRLITIRGRKTRKVFVLPLAEVDGLILKRSMMGRIAGYGAFTLTSSRPDQPRHKVSYLPYPEQLYLEVCSLL